MKSLIFKKLTIISDLQKKAAQFEFSDRYNLIIADGKNSVGKSSVVKNLFWCFGCDPRFDPKWKSLNCKVLLEFSVSGKSYWVARDTNRFFLSEDGRKYKIFSSIGGKFSEKISEILNFNALLPEREDEKVVVPPPSFYFLPFYIDQKQSWANAWNGFDRLGQFKDWKKVIIPYHTGMIKKDYFDVTEEIYATKREKTFVKVEIEQYDTAIGVVDEFVPPIETTLSIDEFSKIQEELKNDILKLHQTQELLFEELASFKADKAHLQSQLYIAEEAVSDLQKDYDFAESSGDELECPTCGVVHDNSLVSRFSILKDKEQAEQVVKRLTKEFKKSDKQVSTKESELLTVREKITELNDKYYQSDKGESISLQNILDSVAAHSVKHKVESHKNTKHIEFNSLDKKEKELTKGRAENSKSSRKSVRERFQELFPSYTAKLKAFGVDSGKIKSPENHSKVAQSGGGAESTRAMLAYYISVYNLIAEYGEEVVGPLVIDTPNQHEQAAKHYQSIVSLIMNDTPSKSQIFLCGMDSEKLSLMKESGKIIKLEKEHSLLQSSIYEEASDSIHWIFELTDGDV